MANDKIQFSESMRKWEALHEEELYSVASEIGTTAILYSDYGIGGTLTEVYREIEYFETEANTIAEHLDAEGLPNTVTRGITPGSIFEEVLEPREVSSVILIGHGNFSEIYTRKDSSITWQEISDESTHLKTGYIEQRFCGNYSRLLSVPFGTFLVTDHSNVIAPKGQYFSPEKNPGHEVRMQPVTYRERLSYSYIKEHFPYHDLSSDESISST